MNSFNQIFAVDVCVSVCASARKWAPKFLFVCFFILKTTPAHDIIYFDFRTLSHELMAAAVAGSIDLHLAKPLPQ